VTVRSSHDGRSASSSPANRSRVCGPRHRGDGGAVGSELARQITSAAVGLRELAAKVGQSLRSEVGQLTVQERTEPAAVPMPLGAAELVDQILRRAVSLRATDVHFEPYEGRLRVRFRIDGQLVEILWVPTGLLRPTLTRLKVLANLDIAEPELPQVGRFRYLVDGLPVDVRITVAPCFGGESACLRLLYKDITIRATDLLGMAAEDLATVRRIISDREGLVLVCGPAGAGKTTTLYCLLHELRMLNQHIVTIEDPVEYAIPGAQQLEVKPHRGLTFASGLRYVLRMDPDVVLVGEIRDPESAQIAVRAALSGKFVFSTLHTRDAVGAIPTLRSLGISDHYIASALRAVIAQRLVRRLCPHCKEPADPDTTARNLFEQSGLAVPEKVFRPVGCSECLWTGYRMRTGVFEVLPVNERLSEAIARSAPESHLRQIASQEGLRPLLTDAMKKVAQGITTVQEVLAMQGGPWQQD